MTLKNKLLSQKLLDDEITELDLKQISHECAAQMTDLVAI